MSMGKKNFAEAGIGVHLALLIGVCVALWGWNYGLYDLSGFDESRYVQVAKELLGRKSVLQLTVQGEPYTEKPWLGFWMMAEALKLNGGRVSSWAARLPAVLFAALTVALTYLIGRRRFGPRAGLIGAFALATAPGFFEEASAARLDMMYAGWTTLALFAWLARDEGRKLSWLGFVLFWGGMAGAVFVKGPLALAIVVVVVGYEAWRGRSWRAVAAARPVLGVAVLGCLVAGWLVSYRLALGPGAVGDLVWRQTVRRVAVGSHGEPFWYYLPRLFCPIFFPWMIAVALAFWHLWAHRQDEENQRLRPFLAWAIFPIVLLTLSHGKRQQYMLPALPGLALIAGWYIDRVTLRRAAFLKVGKTVFAIGAALACALAGGAVFVLAFPGAAARPDFVLTWRHAVGWACAAAALGGLSVWVWKQRGAGEAVLGAVIGVLGIGLLCMNLTVATARNDYRSSRKFSVFLDSLCKEEGGPAVVGVLRGASDPKYHVYGSYQVRQVDVRSGEKTARDGLPAVLVAPARYKNRFKEGLERLGYAVAGEMTSAEDVMVVYRGQRPTRRPPM